MDFSKFAPLSGGVFIRLQELTINILLNADLTFCQGHFPEVTGHATYLSPSSQLQQLSFYSFCN